MKYRFEDFYGTGRLVSEFGKETIVIAEDGFLVVYKGVLGRLYSIRDSSSHVGGHGSCNDYSSQGVLVTTDMKLIHLDKKWNRGFDIEILEEKQ